MVNTYTSNTQSLKSMLKEKRSKGMPDRGCKQKRPK
jgi:hypothetical protein